MAAEIEFLLQVIQCPVFPLLTNYAAERAIALNLSSSGSRSINFLQTSMASYGGKMYNFSVYKHVFYLQMISVSYFPNSY